MRQIAPLLLAGMVALVPATVVAHTELASSDPADAATVNDAPDEVVLTFDGEATEGSTFTVRLIGILLLVLAMTASAQRARMGRG